MTKTNTAEVCKMRRGKLWSFGYLYMTLFILILFFKSSDAAAVWVSDALRLCAAKLIPSLFPFMVLSSLMVSSGLGSAVAKLLRAPFKALFGLGADCACAVIMGWICGFPVGAKCASELYSAGRISLEEHGRVLCICSTPSPAFLIATVGASMLGDKTSGLWLYLISLASAVIVGVFLKLTKPLQAVSATDITPPRRTPFTKALTRAVTEAASGMLSVCAFVVFFSAFLGTLEASISFLFLSSTADSLLFCFFELTSGLSKISSLHSPLVFPLCALATGWSGLSVHFQTIAMCTGTGVRFKPYIISHLARAIICFALAMTVYNTIY